MSDQDYEENLDNKYDQKRTNSLESNMLTPKQYFLVNLSKFIVEMVGTMMIGTFYILMGNEQTGILLGFWVITLFAESISGAHFNPAITLVFMLRKNSTLGQRRLKGIIYIVGQMCGGILAGLLGILVQSGVSIHPRPVLGEYKLDDNGKPTKPEWKFGTFEAYISEIVGSFIFIFLFMLATEKKSQFSEDKVINCFILAAAYVGARLMAGGQMVTCFAHINKMNEINAAAQVNDDIDAAAGGQGAETLVNMMGRLLQETSGDGSTATDSGNLGEDDKFVESWQDQILNKRHVVEAGPLLNPAIGFGLLLTELNFKFQTLQYIFCPFVGSIIALIFYEHVYVKTQELLNEDEVSSAGGNESGLGNLEGEIEPGQQSDEKNDNETAD